MLSQVHMVCHDVGMSLVQTTGAVPTVTLAHRLRIAREFAGLEQEELAERAEIGRTTVVNYERGYRVPRRLYLRAIAEATGVDLHWLETGEASADTEASTMRARRDSNPQPSDWEYRKARTAFTRVLVALSLCQLALDGESHHNGVVQ